MSQSESDDGGPGRREIANRLFAAEFEDANFSYSESDEERAPNYVITPSGARVNRLFLVGVLTEEEWVNDEMLRARIVDPTGAFVTYAGQYQPDALAFLERTEPPAFLAVTGKARTFQPEDSDRVFTSVRPESISEVDGDTRDRWVVEAAKRTIERTETMAAAIETGLSGEELTAALEADGVESSLASGIALALDHYGTTPEYLAALRTLATEALEMIADERDEVSPLDVAPDEGAGDASALADRDLSAETAASDDNDSEDATASSSETTTASDEPTDESESSTETADTSEAEASSPTERSVADSESESPATDAETDASVESELDADSPDATESVGDFEDDSSDTDELGDFETDEDLETEIEEELDDFDPEEDDVLTDEERAEVESEFGTDFSTGAEVEPEPELEPEEEPDAPSEDESETAADETTPEEESDATAEAEAAAESSESADTDMSVDDAVLDAMDSLDDGEGADHDELVATVSEQTGASESVVEDAVEDALMSGQCYEPADGKLKTI